MAADPGEAVYPAVDVDADSFVRWPLLALLLLCAASGFTDAYAFLGHDVFVANMSGNIVLLGLGLGGAVPDLGLVALALVAFLFGIVLGSMLRVFGSRRGPQWGAALPLIAEVVLLAALVVAEQVTDGMVLTAVGGLAVANGIQVVAITRLYGAGVRTTVVTGALADAVTAFVSGLVRRHGVPSGHWVPRFLVAVLAPIGYALGAWAFALVRDDPPAVLTVAGILILVVVALVLSPLPGADRAGRGRPVGA